MGRLDGSSGSGPTTSPNSSTGSGPNTPPVPPANVNTCRMGENQYCAAKKIKLPEFFGFDPRGWIAKAELYFEIHGTSPELRTRLAQLSMSGVAQHWFLVVKDIHVNLSWEQLTQELLQRFSGLEIQNPYEQLSTIKQVNSIHDYIDEFEYLLSLVPRLPESQAPGYFLAGAMGAPPSSSDASRCHVCLQGIATNNNSSGPPFSQVGQHSFKAQNPSTGNERRTSTRIEPSRLSSNSTVGGSLTNEGNQNSTS